MNRFAIDNRSLGLARIVTAAVLLVDLVLRMRDLEALVGNGGAVPLATVREFFSQTWCWSLYWLSESSALHVTLAVLSLFAGTALLFGFHTRVATVACWVLWSSLHTRNPLVVTGGDVLLLQLLFWGMFLPWGNRFAWDARQDRTSELATNSPATAAILLQVAMMYFFTGLWKCNALWFEGRALAEAFQDEMISRPIGRWLANWPLLTSVATWCTLVLELIGPLLLLAARRARVPVLIAFVLMHLMIELSMVVLVFSFASWAALLLFVPGGVWDRWSGGQTADEPRNDGLSRTPTWQGGLATAAMVYLVWLNTATLVAQGKPVMGAPATARPAQLLNWGQRWDMFARPDNLNRRFALLARLEGEESQWDLLRNQPAESGLPPSAAEYDSYRWMLMYREIGAERNSLFRQQFLHYVCRRWNQQHADKQALEAELLQFWVPQSRLGGEFPARALADADLRATGGYRFGVREGPWTFRDDEGKKLGEGPFRGGRQHGRWTLWLEDGSRMTGGYQNGKMHGRWEFEEEDGTVRTQWYHRDEPISSPQ